MKILLTLLPLTLLSVSTASIAKPELDAVAPHTDFMINLVGKAREANCQVPFTQAERDHLSTDLMVVIGGSFKQWVDPNEFPAFLDVINATMNCDSEKWVKDMKHQFATSEEFKAKLGKLKQSTKS
ncbi:hypothetical protein [Photobacterium damselae]|uniref:hypothetical protein n=1 Tax=Photobacterium damselae TaxID=38293 RepID=UPI0030F43094